MNSPEVTIHFLSGLKAKRNISYHQKSLFKNASEKFYPNIEDSSRAAKNKTTQILL